MQVGKEGNDGDDGDIDQIVESSAALAAYVGENEGPDEHQDTIVMLDDVEGLPALFDLLTGLEEISIGGDGHQQEEEVAIEITHGSWPCPVGKVNNPVDDQIHFERSYQGQGNHTVAYRIGHTDLNYLLLSFHLYRRS